MAKAGGKEGCLAVDRMYRESSAKLQGMSSYQDDYHYYVLVLKEVSSFSCCEDHYSRVFAEGIRK